VLRKKESCRCPGNKEKRKKNRISNKCKRKMTKEHLPFFGVEKELFCGFGIGWLIWNIFQNVAGLTV